ncbi:hypothetical protein [Thermohalobacter berrensis]|uniref:Uncharacterized protein n=1 Tax=Thermohalobacter berrensis TaxID=99594 RepID=A0A419SUE6_9FIRM|nr:hypothetical protein [Thermohalobacter berrensis]RKD28782.1 hypothetical protein BET03_07020 [Thermohalobacter berrensis]
MTIFITIFIFILVFTLILLIMRIIYKNQLQIQKRFNKIINKPKASKDEIDELEVPFHERVIRPITKKNIRFSLKNNS